MCHPFAEGWKKAQTVNLKWELVIIFLGTTKPNCKLLNHKRHRLHNNIQHFVFTAVYT